MSKNFDLLQQTNNLHQPAPLQGSTPSHEWPVLRLPREMDWLRIRRTFQKHWHISAIFATTVILTVVLATVLANPVYEPTARLEVDPPGELFSLQGNGGTLSDAEYLETQARKLQSDELAIAVIRKLHLDQNREFLTPGILAGVTGPVLSFLSPRSKAAGKGSSQSAGNESTSANFPVVTDAEQGVLAGFQGSLTVQRDITSRLINVSFASHDPRLSATVTNTLMQLFIENTYKTRHEAIMESTQWLSRQLDDIRGNMERSNLALTEFQRSSGITDLDGNRSTFTEQVSELSRQKGQAESERIQLQSYLQKARPSDINTLPQIQSNEVVRLLMKKLGETRAELSETTAVYGKKHPATKKLQNEIDELEAQLKLQRDTIVGEMQTNYAAALTRERMIEGEMHGATKELGQMAQYAALKKEAQANTDLYNSLYARVKESGIAAASKSTNIRVVDEARVLSSPTRPRTMLNLAFGLLVAIAGGALVAFVREAVDNRIHNTEDIRRATGISSIAVVPFDDNARTDGLHNFVGAAGKAARLNNAHTKFLLHEPHSVQAEALRGIYTSLVLSQPYYTPQALLVASALPGEGKTMVALNMATAFSQQGMTCIVDADLRQPTLGRTFNLNGAPGLSRYLTDGIDVGSMLSAAPDVPNLKIIPAGDPVRDPGMLFSSGRMRKLLETLRRRFAFILFDSPPILPYAEGRVLSSMVDGVIFVGRAGVVTRDALSHSIELLREVHSAPILQLILNGADPKMQSDGYRSGYYKYQ